MANSLWNTTLEAIKEVSLNLDIAIVDKVSLTGGDEKSLIGEDEVSLILETIVYHEDSHPSHKPQSIYP